MKDRKEFGHLFKAITEYTYYPYWKSSSGNDVIVIPPNIRNSSWFVFVVPTGMLMEFAGEDAESRAFCVAETYVRQIIG